MTNPMINLLFFIVFSIVVSISVLLSFRNSNGCTRNHLSQQRRPWQSGSGFGSHSGRPRNRLDSRPMAGCFKHARKANPGRTLDPAGIPKHYRGRRSNRPRLGNCICRSVCLGGFSGANHERKKPKERCVGLVRWEKEKRCGCHVIG